MQRLIPAGATEQYLTLEEGELRVLTGGTPSDRPPLLLVHGGGTDNTGISWYYAFEAFGADRRVVGIDLPGFGGSIGAEPVGGPSRMADLIVRAARELGLPPAVVAGVSMGGDVALNVALRHPDAVAALILVAPGGLTGRVGSRWQQSAYWAAAALPDPLLVAFAWLSNRFAGTAMRAMMHNPDAFPREIADEFVREARAPGAGIGYGRYNQATLGRVGMRNNLLPFVHRISVPTLFFHGAEDPLVSPEGSRRAADRMPNARLALVPETGHWAQLESPERFEAEVRAFLAEVDATAGATTASGDGTASGD